MFVLLGATMSDYDLVMSQPPPTAGSASSSEKPEQ
jgi:hypothetical protein